MNRFQQRRDRIATTSLLVLALGAVSGLAQAQSGPTLSAEDRLEIRQLLDSYAQLLDHCRNGGRDYADLFTDDATFGVSSEWGSAKIWFRGREELIRAGGGMPDGSCRPPPGGQRSYHININPLITATADGAHAESTLLTITNDTNNRGDIVHWEGGYEDTFEKTPAGWRFRSRVHVWPEVDWTDRPEDMPPRNIEDE